MKFLGFKIDTLRKANMSSSVSINKKDINIKHFLFFILIIFSTFYGSAYTKTTLAKDDAPSIIIHNSTLSPITLSATAVSAGKILLTWNTISDSSFTRIRIWKGLSAIPFGESIPGNLYDSIRVPITENSYAVVGLNANTTYYFGAQALTKDGVWTSINENSRVVASTPIATDSILNTIKKTNLTFDTTSNTITVSWCLDESTKTDSLLLGISYSFDGTQNVNAIQFTKVLQLCDSTVINLPSILFDTKYFVALWLSKTGSGVWAKPTINSSISITTPPFTHQVVTFFEKGKEVVTAANGTIRLWTDNVDNMIQTTDILKVHNFKTPRKGFVVVNNGFEFVKKENTPSFFIGLQYSALPSKYLASQIKMFREDSLGNLSVEYLSKIDTLKKIVYIQTNDLVQPFMLLIDTLKPEITIKDTSTIARTGTDINDTIIIKDSVNNVKWKYTYSRGDGGYARADSGYFTKSNENKILTISKNANVINEDNGVRINLTVTDGTFSETINCSRRVYRVENSDVSATSPNKWFPLFVTAKLNSAEPESMLVKLNTDGSLYDKRHARLFRWYSTKPNPSSNEGWVEYSDTTNHLFEFTPGKIMWIKTLKIKQIDFGAGRTLSLKDTFEIKLLPLSWTDFGVPYHFNIKLNDILKCTEKSDSLRFCKWKESGNGLFSASNIYVPGFPNTEWQDKNIELAYENGSGFTVFNSCKDTVTLRIPPTPYSASTASKIFTNDSSWTVKISCKSNNGLSLPEIYCGYKQGALEKYYSASPTFIQNKIAIIDRSNNQMHGLYQTGNLNKGGFAKEIAIVNNSDSTTVFTLSTEQSGNFPSGFKTTFYNPATSKFDHNGIINISAHSTEYRWAITSNNSYLENYFLKKLTLSYSLGTLYPNPCRSNLVIPFTIPLSSDDNIKFEIFDQLGRVVWNKELSSRQAGSQRLVWDGNNSNNTQISAGYYLVRFTSTNANGRISSRFQKPFTYLP